MGTFDYATVKAVLDNASSETGGKFDAFDEYYYAKQANNISSHPFSSFSGTALEHYVLYGAAAGLVPNAWFDPIYYRATYADVNGLSDADLFVHYIKFGVNEGRATNSTLAKFDGAHYLSEWPDVQNYVNANAADFGGKDTNGDGKVDGSDTLSEGVIRNGALAHWIKYGAAEHRLAYDTSGNLLQLNTNTYAATAEIGVTTKDGVVTLDLDTNNLDGTVGSVGHTVLTKTADVADATGKVLHLIGDADVRIDVTATSGQIKGIDLNGDNTISANGVENNIAGAGVLSSKGITIVDAYARNPLNEYDHNNNFFGNINFDGTGYGGDGVSTNGNIVLGGLGADTIKGGIGNDFLTGGGVASNNHGVDDLAGGRNADFFFAELSALDPTDGGNQLKIDGGNTADDSVAGTTQTAQDNDWLLLQASDDDEPVTVVLQDDSDLTSNSNPWDVATGSITLRSTNSVVSTLRDVENVDASGNLYDFLKGTDIKIGGQTTAGGDGLGSSAQLRVFGSGVANVIIGGYDNDFIAGNGGDDLLIGGNLNHLANPNLVGIPNDGKDTLLGGAGNDNIVFEADGGKIDADGVLNADGSISSLRGEDGAGAHDTLWLTANSLGTKTAADLIESTDIAKALRFDLAAQDKAASAGYGGADVAGTQDQTNYIDAATRVTVTNNENVIATGLGAIDYKAAGTNNPDLAFANQQNFKAYEGDLDLRGLNGTSGVVLVGQSGKVGYNNVDNILYASTGNDVIEGRQGNDNLSGGAGADDFYFGSADSKDLFPTETSVGSGQTSFGDGVDIIWRQHDLGNNLTDGTFERDFGIGQQTSTTASYFQFILTDDGNDNKELDQYITGTSALSFKLAGTSVEVNLSNLPSLTYANVATLINDALAANADFAGKVSAKVDATDPNKILIEDTAGRTFDATASWTYTVKSPAHTDLTAAPVAPTESIDQDRIIYKAYEDRADNEGVDDNAITGSTISLGVDSYAQDRVVGFVTDATTGKVSTRIAEDQQYQLHFTNLTTQDLVTVEVNGVKYQLTVGKDLDGNSLAAEDGLNDTQAGIQAAFLERLAKFITETFTDDDTAAGKVHATYEADTSTLGTGKIILTQAAYNDGEQTVFMNDPVVAIDNASGGEKATVAITNDSNHDLTIFEYDGRVDGNNSKAGGLNEDNVLFIGQENVNQSVLATAKVEGGDLNGYDADIIDGGKDDLKGYTNNTATNASLAKNFSVHGDDLLIGGVGNDVISGFTGDDRVLGSLGTDTINGGKNYYAVKVLGQAESVVVQLSDWEAHNYGKVAAVTSLGTISSISLINQTEDGNSVVDNVAGVLTGNGVFQDTLQFQQADFSAKTKFTIVLDGYELDNGVQFKNDGAGKVLVDDGGDGTNDATTTFTNFENIRTVSGTSFANANVAGIGTADGGQGRDTLDVNKLSHDTSGVFYNLTNDLFGGKAAGQVSYSKGIATGHANGTQDTTDYTVDVIKVDGVENVLTTGTLTRGSDLLVIDETEAAKDNIFDAGLGNDRIIYTNDFGLVSDVDEETAEPTITIKVLSAGEETVTSTSGRVGQTVATDTLHSVERITLSDHTAQGSHEADELNVTALTSGAVVDYTNGEVRSSLVQGTGVDVTIDHLFEVETVTAGEGSDTVIVADAERLYNNATADEVGDAKNITFSTFLDYDDLNGSARVTFGTDPAKITQVINEGEYTFNLGNQPTAGADTVDYSKANDAIAVVVEFDTAKENQYVLVDGTGTPFDGTVSLGDRIDVLTNVERIVASQGESVLDLTGARTGSNPVPSDKTVVVEFSKLETTLDALGVKESSVSINTESSSGIKDATLARSYVEYRDISGTDSLGISQDATWNRIEGSDLDERVVLSSLQSTEDVTLNLRGGDNTVKYNELTRSITTTLALTAWDAADPKGTVASGYVGSYQSSNTAAASYQKGTITAITQFQDGNNGALLDGGTHVVTSYTADNGIATGALKGSLTIAASQDAEDTLEVAGLSDKTFLLADTGTNDNQITVKLGSSTAPDSVVLTGYEIVKDAASNDVYQFGSIKNAALGLDFVDNALGDHDTVRADVSAASGDFGGVLDTTISLHGINITTALATAGFDFDVLDITKIDSAKLTTVVGETVVVAAEGVAAGVAAANIGTTDELVVGKINNLATVNAFEAVVLTQATVNEVGTTFVLNTTANTLTAGAKTLTFNNDLDTLSFGGTVLEQTATLRAETADLNATSGVTVTVTGAENVSITGGNGNDSITGGAGNDVLRGGKGNDTLDGNFVPEAREVHTYTISNPAAGAGETVIINGFTVTEGTVIRGVAVANNDADAIGAAFVREWNANPASFGHVNDIQSVTYDALTNALSFSFTSLAGDVGNAVLGNNSGTATTVSAELVQTAYAARAESADTFVFEKTALLNGVDTINNFNDGANSDKLDVSAFLGTTVPVPSAVKFNAAGVVDLTAAGNEYAVVFNKASLTADDISYDRTHAGKIALEVGSKAVVVTTADADGVADATNNGYSVYYIEAGAKSTDAATVTKVATLNSASELNALSLDGITGLHGTTADDVLVGNNAANIINGLGGNDTLTGGAGNDTLIGGAGNDTFNVDAGTDTISDLTTADTLKVSVGATAIASGVLNFTGYTVNNSGTVEIDGTAAADTIVGSAGVDHITGAAGADVINGGPGNDVYAYGDTITDSNISTTATAAAGFDQVTFTSGDVFDFWASVTAAQTSPVDAGAVLGATGTAVLGQLQTAFLAGDDGAANVEAAVISFTGGEKFLVVDTNTDGAITAADQIVQLVGTVTGISFDGVGNVVIA